MRQLPSARFAIGVLIGLVPCTSVLAQESGTVISVEVRGTSRSSPTYVEEVARVKPGDAADKAALDEAVARLLRTGRFLTATYAIEPGAGGVRLIFDVKERPVVTKITFEGSSQ